MDRPKPQGAQPRNEVLAAVSTHAADMAEQDRFPDGSYCRMCDVCDTGCPIDEWKYDRCPECGANGGDDAN